MDKTLGQIAHEAGEKAGRWARKWADMSERQRVEWEAIAAAVAAAVKEEDARIVEDMPVLFDRNRLTNPDDCAAAIRASIKEAK